jgi:hypothetical protein
MLFILTVSEGHCRVTSAVVNFECPPKFQDVTGPNSETFASLGAVSCHDDRRTGAEDLTCRCRLPEFACGNAITVRFVCVLVPAGSKIVDSSAEKLGTFGMCRI